MTETPSSVRHHLATLIQTCKDGQEGYRIASEHIDDPEIRSLVWGFSLQRSRFAGELQAAAIHLGEHDPANTGTVVGAFHRTWLDLKGFVTGRGLHQLLSECEAADIHAAGEYSRILDLALPSDIQDIIESQHTELEATLRRITALRESVEEPEAIAAAAPLQA